MKRLIKNYIYPLIFFAFMMLVVGNLNAQTTTIIMPHQDTAVLHINQSNCYTILDPGGLSHYDNNEDSWLYIISDDNFILNIDYKTGAYDDGNDYIDIYYDTNIHSDPNVPYARYCGTGSAEWGSWSSRALIHFHSNPYAVFDGFSIQVQFNNTIYSFSEQVLSNSSVRLSWLDNNSSASQWTVHYFCDDDSVQTLSSNTCSATLTGLRNNTHYAYYVTNDVIACMRPEKRYFRIPNSENMLYLMPDGMPSQSDTLHFGNCYTVFNPSGPDSNHLTLDWGNLFLYSADSTPFFIVGNHNVLPNDYMSLEVSSYSFNHSWGYWGESHGYDSLYCPNGYLHFYFYHDFPLQYRILWENTPTIRPSVSHVSPSAVTLSWTDASASSSYRVRYSYDEVHWQSRQTSSRTLNLTGLLPGHQYIYTIQGNLEDTLCTTPARHAFFTSQSADTILMPYRGTDTLTLSPGSCYTILDAGGNGNYFHNDNALLVIRSSNGKGFRITGNINLHNTDRLAILVDGQWVEYSDYHGRFYCNVQADSAQLCFFSDGTMLGEGFALSIEQPDTAIYNQQATAITNNSATITWNDASGASAWELHYGSSEDNLLTVATTTPSVTLTGLSAGTQYLYFITRPGQSSPCSFNDRKAFITSGLPANTRLMPYRGIDTLWVSPGNCYTIFDAGGTDNDYFDYDTSQMVILSTDGQDFSVTISFDYDNENDYYQNSYDGSDILYFSDNSDWWNWSAYGYNNFYENNIRRESSFNGYMRVGFFSNHFNHRHGYHIQIDRDPNTVTNVSFSNLMKNSVEVSWDDNSGSSGPWTIYYTPQGGATLSTTSASSHATLNGLSPATTYDVSIISSSLGTSSCDLRKYQVRTIASTDIIMRSHQHDTVWLSPGTCYTIYDPGGMGNYHASDTCSLLLRSTSGVGFCLSGYVEVGSTDYSDRFSFYNDDGGQYWWSVEEYYPEGEALIKLTTNEALQNRGFALKVTFAPTIKDLDTLWVTDTSARITWHDTSLASHWTIHYGPRYDSMTTITSTTPFATLTGLRRNTQCFIQIENDFGSADCFFPSIYGLLMPHDNDYWITQYRNYHLLRMGYYSRFHHPNDTLPNSGCLHIYSNSGPGSLFPNDDGDHSFHSPNGEGIAVRGHYDMGDVYFYLYSNFFNTYYNRSGSLDIYSTSGDLNFNINSHNIASSYPEGFHFQLFFNYPIYNIHDTILSCSSVRLSWQDSSASASQWFIAYGTSEHSLDTVVSSQRNYTFSSLTPDRQYVCYLWNNSPLSSCSEPIKYYFITTCDTSLIIMPANRDTYRTININSCYTITDPGGPNDYFYSTDQHLHLRSNTGDPFILRGWYEIADNESFEIRDEGTGETFIWWTGEDHNFELQTHSDRLEIFFRSNGDTVVRSGFSFDIRFNAVTNLRTDLMTDTSCRIRWDDHSSGSQWFFHYGSDKAHMTTIPTNEKQVHLSGLSDGTLYYVYITNNAVECIDTTWFQFCAGGDNCIDFANLYSCHTHPSYGRTFNPDEYQGVIDYGYYDILSRHTVIDDTSLYDPRTGNQLRCTPPGEGHAVRLGNWDIGGGAESITYEYVVDSSINNILLLRYAAVLENPSHSADNQPRFRFAIVDEYGNELDHQCYSADFVSSTELGWNQYSYDTNYILWKDWTPVGIDLEPFHGQRIFVKLTTYDCGEMGHFGYAYFHLSCSQKNIRVGACGVVDTNVFTAPEGFRYKWYNIDSADVTLSTERTFHSDEAGIYRCRCSFVGNNSNNCYFEKTVVVGSVFPYAAFRHEVIDTNECNIAVKFYNQSCVATDSNRTHLTSMECDDFFWDFGDGTTSTDINPTHNFAPGHYEVTLRSSLAGLECSHDSTFILSTASPCIRFDTLRPVICHNASYTFLDTTLYTPDTTLLTPPSDPVLQSHFVRREYRPDSIVETTIFLTINPVFWNDTAIIACDSFYWSQTDSTYFFATTADKLWQNQYGCDSSYHLQLQVERSFDTTSSASACDNVGYILFNDTIFQSGTYTDSLHTIYGCDSLLRLDITIYPSYNTDTFAAACDKFYWPRRDSTYRLDTLASLSLLCRDTLASIHNCDSIFTLHLDLHPSYNLYDSIYLCRYETYNFNGRDYTAPDTFSYSLSSSHNCDSSHHVSLSIHDTLFRADWLLSDDSATWVSDSLFEVCTPFILYGRSQSVNAASLEWIFDDAESSSQTSVAHPYEAGSYLPSLIAVSAHNCRDTVSLSHPISVFPSPEAHFYWDPVNPSDGIPQATFLNTSSPNDSTCHYLWFFQKADGGSEMDSSSLFSPTYVWEVSQLQEPLPVAVQLIAYQTFVAPSDSLVTCTDTLTDTVTILSDFLQFPNLVTPNGDGTNDTWIVINLLEYNRYPVNHLIIYDRWGHVVFNVENISSEEQFWDPVATHSPDGTYFFVFTGRGEHNEYSIRRTGAIEVLGSGNN